jgi:hypothetical protein
LTVDRDRQGATNLTQAGIGKPAESFDEDPG